MSDEKWNYVAPYLALIDEQAPQRRHSLREVFNTLRWLARLRLLSRDFECMSHVLVGLHFVVFAMLMLPKVVLLLAPGTSS